MNDFEFYSEEHVNKLQAYIEEHFALYGQTRRLIRNILDYAAKQSEDNESALVILEMLLDSIGITREGIVHAVMSES